MKKYIIIALLAAGAISTHAQIYTVTLLGTIRGADAFTEEHGNELKETVVLDFQPTSSSIVNGTFSWTYRGNAALTDDRNAILAATMDDSVQFASHTFAGQYASFSILTGFGTIVLGSSNDSVIGLQGVPFPESGNSYDLINSGMITLLGFPDENVFITSVDMSISRDPGIPLDPGTPQVPAPGAVPEPSTYGLLGAAALLSISAWRRKQLKAS